MFFRPSEANQFLVDKDFPQREELKCKKINSSKRVLPGQTSGELISVCNSVI